ncbi:MAG: bifunctional diguanylate cyclase/phosphodiesterase [Pacificimonas sp.]|jgi:diguanylate cyclase (GGDEF)-like protein|nr:bifunctional diguanylate cyclase/phosphodiesterase [Pacificimonas sp.]
MAATQALSKLSLTAGQGRASETDSGSAVPSSLVEALPIGIAVFQGTPGGAALCTRVNARLTSWADVPSEAFVGRTAGKLPLLSAAPLIAEHVARVFGGTGTVGSTINWSCTAGAEDRHFSAEVSAFDDSGYRRALVCVRDRSSELYAETHLRASMMQDTLTGLPNRLALTERIDELLEQGGLRPAVFLVNVDRFTRINESLGAVVGDEFLIAVASRLSGSVRSHDLVARLAADEFAILVNDLADDQTGAEVVGRVNERLAHPFSLSGGDVYASATIGIAVANDSAECADDLLHQADYALRTAKEEGGDSVETYLPRDHSHEIGLFHLEAELRRALERDELTLAFQPVIDLETGAITGAEALSRWHSSNHGVVAPADFIPIAEESGLIVPLGRAAIRQACNRLADWRRLIPAAADLQIAVNVSSVQFRRDDLVATVVDALERVNLPGSALKVELTESAIVSEPDRVRTVFQKLKDIGCTIAMDDFGTGYSSMAYLQSFPIDILKIDQSFVRGMLESEDSQNIIDAILSLASSLNMKTVAEGIETHLQMRALKAAGCDYGQGFYFARPLSEEDFIAKLGETA